jgi:hypothetical protein
MGGDRVRFAILIGILSLVSVASARGATLHTDAFDAGVQGWASGGGAVSHSTSGGPGGFVTVGSFNHLAVYNNDDRWTGSLSSVGAAVIRADLMVAVGQPALAMRIVLFGGGEPRGAVRWTSAEPQPIPADGVWRTYEFPLGPADIVSPGAPTASYDEIMGGISRLMFRHDAAEPNHSLDDATDAVEGQLNLDNITLAAADVPPTPGDFNGDTFVNAADLNDPEDGWRARFGTDLDGNAFLNWQRNLTPVATTPAAAVVPEPGTLVLAFAAAALVALRRDAQSAIV